jgi:hypothetical protein
LPAAAVSQNGVARRERKRIKDPIDNHRFAPDVDSEGFGIEIERKLLIQRGRDPW